MQFDVNSLKPDAGWPIGGHSDATCNTHALRLSTFQVPFIGNVVVIECGFEKLHFTDV